jgi:pyruvate/2-oxoglutarate dehydrogenase complex dihydrolipoamide acyltransferase (E2) component
MPALAPIAANAPSVAATPEAPKRAIKLAPRNFSPLVRRIAEEYGLDLDYLVNTGQVIGTGEGGRVTKQDLVSLLPCLLGQPTPERSPEPAPITFVAPAPTPPPVVPAPQAPSPTPPPAQAPQPAQAATEDSSEGDIIIPFTGMRKMIADHLVKSAFTAPHVTTVAEADVTRLVAYRSANKETWEREYGLKLTYTPFFVKATAEALASFPMVNSSIQGDKIVARKAVHMGVAVSLGSGGLIVPVIHNAHQKDLFTLARELEDMAKRARDGSLTTTDVQGGTFTITNPGIFGAILSTPIINSPQSAILGVEAIRKMVVVRDDDSLAVRSMMYLCLSYDHRVVDGETSIKFLQHLRKSLEEFRFFR